MSTFKGYIALPITTFFSGISANADIFLALSENKLILLIKEGSIIDLDQLKNYKDREISELFIKEEDYSKVIQRQISVAGIIVEKSEIPDLTKISVLNKVAQTVYDEFDHMGLEKQAYQDAKEVSKSIVNLINSKTKMLNLLDSLNKISDGL